MHADWFGQQLEQPLWNQLEHPSLKRELEHPSLKRELVLQLTQKIHTSLPSLASFCDGTVLYILSREWHDELAVHCLRLHPLPFCDADNSGLPCTQDASSATQACFAVLLLLFSLALQPIIVHYETMWRSLAVVPRGLGMCSGWAAWLLMASAIENLKDVR